MNTISKAAAIRDVLKELGADAKPKQVIARLKERHIAVTTQQVTNEKAKLKAKSVTVDVGDLPVSVLKKVNTLVEELGSTEIVRRALDELDALRGAHNA